MSDGWDDAEEATKGSGAGEFLKLEDGQSATIAVVGSPCSYTAKPYEGKPNAKPSTKALLSVFNLVEKKLQTWDMAGATFSALLEVTGKPSKPGKFPITRWTYTVKRKGTATKTRYTILPDKELTEAQTKFLASLSVPDLGALADKLEYVADDVAAVDLNRQPAQSSRQPAASQDDEDDESIPF